MSEEITKTESSASVAPVVRKRSGGGVLWLVGIVLLIVVALVGAKQFGLLSTDLLPGGGDAANGGGSADVGDAVAKVNGIAISRAELDRKLDQVRKNTPAGMPDQTQDAGFELKLLDEIINLRLLVIEAEKNGITVSDEQVNAELATLKQTFGGDEQFAQQLAASGLSEQELNENMRNEIAIRQLVDMKTDVENVTASDEEISQSYTAATAGATENVPALNDVKDMIRAEIIQAKSADIVQAYIDELRTTAQIEVLL